MTALTERDRQFADRHHDVVYRFLRSRGLSVNEYYDVVIFRYLGAVQRYLSEPELRQYKFDTIAWNAMRSALGHHFAAEKRRKALYVTDTCLVETAAAYERDEDAETTSTLLWLEVAAHLTPSEIDMVRKRADGLTYEEIAPELGVHPKTVSGRMYRLRKRLQGQIDLERLLSQILQGGCLR
ncbi:MAG: sigma-70 family RNA polymerase sigma factor [Clostridia bacterium]|nr:sigma-70 family RNA polymerase sigma factor [Clostridia bacterium]